MNKLEEMIGFVRNGRRPDVIRTLVNIISKPDLTACNFSSFVFSTIEAPTTIAHKALSLLATNTAACILTENIDLLQEAAGTKPLFAGSKEVHDMCTPHNLQQIDLLICVGLSHDDRGFIGAYKTHNPQGKVIALDFKKPTYLDSNDLLVQGDIQLNLPLIWNYLNDCYLSKNKKR